MADFAVQTVNNIKKQLPKSLPLAELQNCLIHLVREINFF